MPVVQRFDVGYRLVGAATAVRCGAVAHWLAELVTALTDRPVPPRKRRRLRGAVRLRGVACVLLGV